jgi:hypothetical protein
MDFENIFLVNCKALQTYLSDITALRTKVSASPGRL